MKRLIIILSAVALLASCGNGLEHKAKRQMRKTMLEIAKNPETFKIDNVKTVISNDSLCVLSFITRGQNGFGGYSMSSIEYVYVKEREKDGAEHFYESIKHLDEDNDENEDGIEHPSIVDVYNEIKNSKDKNILNTCKIMGFSTDEYALSVAYTMSLINGKIFGGEVEE